MNSLVTELKNTTAKERLLLAHCKGLMSIVAALQVTSVSFPKFSTIKKSQLLNFLILFIYCVNLGKQVKDISIRTHILQLNRDITDNSILTTDPYNWINWLSITLTTSTRGYFHSNLISSKIDWLSKEDRKKKLV